MEKAIRVRRDATQGKVQRTRAGREKNEEKRAWNSKEKQRVFPGEKRKNGDGKEVNEVSERETL